MNHAKIYASIALAGILLSGCASSGSTAATQADYNAALADAKKSLTLAKKARFEWRDSGKILRKAQKAAKEGSFGAATRLANKAKRQGDLAIAQSKAQANAGPR